MLKAGESPSISGRKMHTEASVSTPGMSMIR
jgi:hypothetical protein